MKQNDILTVDIIDYGMNGEGIAKQDGYVIFIPFALKGERVKIKVKFVKKNFANAELIDVVSPSEFRIKPPCAKFTKCGGCDLLNVQYNEQLNIKKQALANTLRKNAGIQNFEIDDCIPSGKIFGYRNKVQLPFGKENGRVVVGFFQENTHKVVPINKCFLHEVWLEKLIKIVLDFANKFNISVYDEFTQAGVLRHLVARSLDGALSVVLVINGDDLPHKNEIIKSLSDTFKNFSLYLSINKENTNVVMGARLVTLKENPIKIDICGVSLSVNPMSFLQVNNEIRDAVYNRVIEKTADSDIVIDAFSGVGLIGAMLAKRGVKKVYNIEIVKEAVDDANVLAKENGLEDRITNILGDTAIELPKLISQIMKSDKLQSKISIILDPPRKGVDKPVIDALNGIDYPVTLIYISCNPATLSRDLALLLPNYTINSITPFDMFANTRHVETLICLSKKS